MPPNISLQLWKIYLSHLLPDWYQILYIYIYYFYQTLCYDVECQEHQNSDGCVYAQIRKGLGMHLVTFTNRDTVPFQLLDQYKGSLSEIEFTVTLFSNAGMILLSFLKILCISSYIKGGIAHFC